jgi:hypothetical protein
MHGRALRHFQVAGSLIRYSRQDYKLGSAAFFHAVIGLEKALRLHYQPANASLQELLRQASEEKLINDAMFGNMLKFSERFEQTIRLEIGKRPTGHSELLVELIPKLRNEYMHGEFILAPDLIHLTRQVRMIADRLDTNRRP